MTFYQSVLPAVTHFDRALADEKEITSEFKDGKFTGVKISTDRSVGSHIATAWKFLFSSNQRKPGRPIPTHPVELSHFNTPGTNQLNATWLGHSSLMINIDGYRILTDPVFKKRISVVGPSRFNGEVPLDIHRLPSVDAVIISHDHYDHLSKHAVRHLKGKTKTFIVPLAVGQRLVTWGVSPDNIVELDWWKEYRFDETLKITATPAQHFSGRSLTDRNTTLWASWVITTPLHRVFFSGDSGYFDGFKQIGNKFGPFDMTFLECGAYDLSWEPVHMLPEQTVQAHRDLKGHVLQPIHWATFNLALHAWYDPMVRATAAANAAQVKIATPVVGETTLYGRPLPNERWWEQAME